MLDPLSAVGLCASILQFVEFVTKLISVGDEIHKSTHGTIVEHLELEVVTQTIISLNGQISGLNEEFQTGRSLRDNVLSADRDIEQLGAACNTVAGELLEALDRLKAKGPRAKWNSMAHAIKTVWAKGRIESLRTRLEGFRSVIQTALLISLRFRRY